MPGLRVHCSLPRVNLNWLTLDFYVLSSHPRGFVGVQTDAPPAVQAMGSFQAVLKERYLASLEDQYEAIRAGVVV